MSKPAILTNKITAVLSAVAIQLNTEVSLVLVIAIVAAITKTRTEIGSRRLKPSARFEWMRKELEGLSRRLVK
jgi:5-enolpyruvylshikimate-3-phosphate synthase